MPPTQNSAMKDELDRLVREYKKMDKQLLKGHFENDPLEVEWTKAKMKENLESILILLEPLIRGRVLSLIYSIEKLQGRYRSEPKDLFQEMRMRVAPPRGNTWGRDGKEVKGIVRQWVPSRGTHFYSFANSYITSHLKNMMLLLHKNSDNKIVDYQLSLDQKMFSDEVSELRLGDTIADEKVSQEDVVGVKELGKAVSSALCKEIEMWKKIGGHYRKCDTIFEYYLEGLEVKKIAHKVKQPESAVRLVIRRITRRVRYSLSAQYQKLYEALANKADVKIQLLELWI